MQPGRGERGPSTHTALLLLCLSASPYSSFLGQPPQTLGSHLLQQPLSVSVNTELRDNHPTTSHCRRVLLKLTLKGGELLKDRKRNGHHLCNLVPNMHPSSMPPGRLSATALLPGNVLEIHIPGTHSDLENLKTREGT